MISKDTLRLEWINQVSAKNRRADKILIEKVIRALMLLEGLAESDLQFVFKGGTAVMLLQDIPGRFSIDIDIIVLKEVDFDAIFKTLIKEKGFSKYERQSRNTVSGIQKLHYKFYYTSLSRINTAEDNVLLDILVESSKYKHIIPVNIDSRFVKHDGLPVKVNIPSKEDILADKLTAFAPNTTGIPYEKGGFSRAMEIIKQLYDIGNLFDEIDNVAVIGETFNKIVQTEMKYRGMTGDIEIVLNDIFQTALCLSTKGKAGKGDFTALQNGVSRIRAYIFSESYHIEKAIIHASRIAYLVKMIELKEKTITRFENPEQIRDFLMIENTLDTKLNKLKKSSPEAFFYWYQVYLRIKNQNR
ncbi:MAG: nucleotidyl transferase AbiEii/AbiGii toxin family protein [bacterium]